MDYLAVEFRERVPQAVAVRERLREGRRSTEVLADAEKPARFRLGRTDSYWSSKGRTKSELDI